MLPTSTSKAHEVIKASLKNMLQDALEAKLDGHLEYGKWNAKVKQGVLTQNSKRNTWAMDLKLPRNRDVSFKSPPRFSHPIKHYF